jgi:hypothetical protein
MEAASVEHMSQLDKISNAQHAHKLPPALKWSPPAFSDFPHTVTPRCMQKAVNDFRVVWRVDPDAWLTLSTIAPLFNRSATTNSKLSLQGIFKFKQHTLFSEPFSTAAA